MSLSLPVTSPMSLLNDDVCDCRVCTHGSIDFMYDRCTKTGYCPADALTTKRPQPAPSAAPQEAPLSSPPRILVVYGTRPEQIKLQPLIGQLRARGVTVVVLATGQSPDLTDPPGKGSDAWRSGLTLGLTQAVRDVEHMLLTYPYDALIVQGDTASAFAGALAGFLAQVPVAHVEAGLRTYATEPFPEEGFRRAITPLATWHFCPDQDAAHNVIAEGAPCHDVFTVGNTVIDTLPRAPLRVLVTLHRRENWGTRIKAALRALDTTPGVRVTAIRHPNWAAQGIREADYPDLTFVAPEPHDAFLTRLQNTALVVTDSGGLQEEAAHFGIPVLVLRTSTERTALEARGAVTLVHPDDPDALRNALDDAVRRRTCYGQGHASALIATHLLDSLDVKTPTP